MELNPAAVASSWPDAPAAVPRPGAESLSGEDLGQGWTKRMIFDTVAAVVPGARAVLRRLVEVGGTASYEEVQDRFAVHPETPIDPKRIGGTLTSIRAVRRRVGPDNRSNLLERDDRRRIYWIEPALLEGLKRAFDLADARPDLLRQEASLTPERGSSPDRTVFSALPSFRARGGTPAQCGLRRRTPKDCCAIS